MNSDGASTKPALEVSDLHVGYRMSRGVVHAVNGVSFRVGAGERFGLVGESGSGKSTVALSILRLIKSPGRIERGKIRLGGVDVMALTEEQMRQTRLAGMALISQGAMNSLNPVTRIRPQIEDGLRYHGVRLSRRERDERVARLLERVGLPAGTAAMFPHELSGGMKQRTCIAIAISLSPRLIIADEPTSALDVVVQRQVMETLRSAQESLGAAVILIGHDMGLMAQFVDRIGIVYGGKMMEEGSVEDIFIDPRHPYTRVLMASLPTLERKEAFGGAPGFPPSLLDPPSGCVFHPRCPVAIERCSVEQPGPVVVGAGHWAACHMAGAGASAARREPTS